MQSLSPESILFMALAAFIGLVNWRSKQGSANADMTSAQAKVTALMASTYEEDRAAHTQTRNRLADVEKELTTTNSLLRQTESDRDAARKAMSEMYVAVEQAKAEIESLRGLRQQVQDLQAELTALKRTVEIMGEEKQTLIEQREQAIRLVDDLRRQLNEERTLREQLQVEVEKLKKVDEPEHKEDG